MFFNSYEFIFAFLPITFFIYFYLNSKRLTIAAKGFLVFASLFFYSWWDIAYLPLILSSIFFNYLIGTTLSKSNENNKIGLNKSFSKKSILIFGIISNVALLGYFKYTDFFLENFNGIFDSNIPLQYIILPLGISFFTFTQIAFLVDAYRNVEEVNNRIRKIKENKQQSYLKIDREALLDFQKLIKRIKSNNIQIYRYFYPIYKEIYDLPNVKKEYLKYKELIIKEFDSYDVIWDFNIEEYNYIRGEYSTYSGGIHLSEGRASKILEVINEKINNKIKNEK